jgi:hypothetical protein
MPPLKKKNNRPKLKTATRSQTQNHKSKDAENPKRTNPKPKPKSTTKPQTPRKKRGDADPGPALELSRGPSVPDPFENLLFSAPWMNTWAAEAATTGSIELACKAANVSLAQFSAARRTDREFDEVVLAHERVVDLMITDKLCNQAIQGDARSQALYYNKVRELMRGTDDGGPAEAYLSAAVAEAAIRAALAEKESQIAHKAVTPPAPSSPPPKPKRPRKSQQR